MFAIYTDVGGHMSRYPNDFTVITAELVSIYVGNNPISSKDIPTLISTVHAALVALSPAIAEPSPEFVSAVTPRKSLASPDYIISMIDGKPYRSLKRHLAAHGLTPEEYRARYSLKPDYPMVAPAYSQALREVAKRIGLGRKPAVKADVETKRTSVPAREKISPEKRKRRPKVEVRQNMEQ